MYVIYNEHVVDEKLMAKLILGKMNFKILTLLRHRVFEMLICCERHTM